METLTLDGQALSLAEIEAVAVGRRRVEVSAGARERGATSRALIERIVAEGQTVYGVNTGFGKLADVRISTTTWRSCRRTWCGVMRAEWDSR